MRKILNAIAPFLMFTMLNVTAYAEVDMVKAAQINTVATNAAAVKTSRSNLVGVNGWLEYIVIDFSGSAGPDIDIDITTVANTGSGASRTLWTADNVTADAAFAIRGQALTSINGTVGITNTVGRIPLVGETIRVDAYDSDTNSVILDVYLYISDK